VLEVETGSTSPIHTPYVAYIWDFCKVIPSPWVPLPALIVTVSTFTATYFQQVHKDFPLTLYLALNVAKEASEPLLCTPPGGQLSRFSFVFFLSRSRNYLKISYDLLFPYVSPIHHSQSTPHYDET